MLQKKGVPGIVERTLIRPPSSQLGPITGAERDAVLASSDLAGKYENKVDRESAYEVLKARADKASAEAAAAEEAEEVQEQEDPRLREFHQARRFSGARVARSTSRRVRRTEGIGDAVAHVVIKELKGTTGRRIVRGLLGGLFKGR